VKIVILDFDGQWIINFKLLIQILSLLQVEIPKLTTNNNKVLSIYVNNFGSIPADLKTQAFFFEQNLGATGPNELMNQKNNKKKII